MEWHEIKERKDINYLLEEYCGFHDSCLVELNYKSGTYIDEEGSMNFGTNKERELHMIFQSQCTEKVLELCFTDVKRFHVGEQDDYSCEIFQCYLEICSDLNINEDKDLIVWADNENFNPRKVIDGLNEPSTTYVIAGNLKWRYLREIKGDF